MRVSRVQATENRQTVINVASRLFREHGFDGIGLKDLMEGAGLTQGAFYKQFSSKEDLATQASARALESATRRCLAAIAANLRIHLAQLSLTTLVKSIAKKGWTAAQSWRLAQMPPGKAPA